MRMLETRRPNPPPPRSITKDEVELQLASFQNGKSTGDDAVTYELLKVVMQTDLAAELVCSLNEYSSRVQSHEQSCGQPEATNFSVLGL